MTVSLDAGSVRRSAFGKRRNTTEYDHAGVTLDAEVDQVRAVEVSVRDQVVGWIKTARPDLES